MRNMVQLLGGVAAAGVIAAGSTAFTAAGLTNNVAGTSTFIGGTTSHTITGATLTAISFTADTAQTPTRVSAFAMTLSGAADGTTVVATTPGATGGGGTPATAWTCTPVSSNASTCTANNSGYFTGVATVNIQVG
ncbi:hypothetical protein [Actinoplanes sp. G11-F43]|uniref:hypothetical protein n=1 Tax=Actinoplanes sp. G11-F43 TaxID=3424130 RepID=UPI003D344D87